MTIKFLCKCGNSYEKTIVECRKATLNVENDESLWWSSRCNKCGKLAFAPRLKGE